MNTILKKHPNLLAFEGLTELDNQQLNQIDGGSVLGDLGYAVGYGARVAYDWFVSVRAYNEANAGTFPPR